MSTGGSAGASGSSGLAVGGRAGGGGLAGAGGLAGTAGIAGSGGSSGAPVAAASTIAAGDDHSCAIVAGGAVSCWGARGDLPTEDQQPILISPSKVPLPPMQTLVGHRHFCAIAQETRALYCWGEEAPGAIASKLNVFSTPIDVGAPVDEVAVALRTTCIRQQGVVSCFGLQSLGGTGAAQGAQDKTAVPDIVDAISLMGNGSYFCARRPAAGGAVKATCWGEGLLEPTDVPGETSVESIAITGEGYVLVRRTDGSVGAHRAPSGSGSGATFGPALAVPMPPVDAIVADNALCGIRTADKRVVCANLVDHTPATVGTFQELQGLPVDDPPVEISTSASHSNYGLDTSCVRTQSGKSYCWGADRWGQTGTGAVGWELVPKTVPNVQKATRLYLGNEGTLAILEDGPAVAWGSLRALGHLMQNDTSQPTPKPLPGSPTQLASVTIGDYDGRIYGVTKTGGLYAAEFGTEATKAGLQAFPETPTFVPGVGRLRGIDFGVANAGSGTFLAFYVEAKDDASLGDSGILANGGGKAKTVYSSQPLPGLVGFAYGSFHGLAWDGTGTLYCWGLGDTARCGQKPSETENVRSPIPMSVGEPIAMACGGWDHTCAITKSGKLRCWGGTNYGLGGKLGSEQTPDDKGITETLQGVACGDYTACAWSDKVVYCWGENDTGQLGLGDRKDRPLPTLVPGLPGAKHIALGPEFSCAVKLDGDVACWGSPSGGRLGNGELGFHRTEARPVLGLP